jgi:hypothetical protein
MARKKGQLIELEKIRGAKWVDLCLRVASAKATGKDLSSEKLSQCKMIQFTKAVDSPDLWSKYKLGYAQPEVTTVKAVQFDLPGTAEIWLMGPYGLPLWTVLAGNAKENSHVPSKLLDAELHDEVRRPLWSLLARQPFSTMPLLEKVQALLEVSVSSGVWSRPGAVNRSFDEWEREDAEDENYVGVPEIDFRFAPRDKHFLTLQELIQKTPNVFAESYANDSHKVRKSKYRFGRGEKRIFEPKRLLAIIAVVVLLARDKKNAEIQTYIVNGIREAVSDKFGRDVAAYISAENNVFDGLLPEMKAENSN